MKRLVCFDLDGTLLNTFSPEEGKPMWEKFYSEKYPHKGWWGRKESLDTDVFDIKPFPNILAKLQADMAEKLRPQLENILNLNGIKVDELITKRGGEDKGDIILKIENYNQDLEEIVIYDDFAGMQSNKIAEYTKIKDLILPHVQYNIFYVENGRTQLMESTNILLKMIQEELGDISF
jgi:FMN phosphatase YigB (HAD superfamily)